MTISAIPLAFCITDLDPGGAERCLAQLVTRLDRSMWEPAVVCLGPEAELAEVIRAAGIEVTCLGGRSALDLPVITRLARQLRRGRPQLLQCFLFHANLVGRIAGRLAGVPVVVSGVRVAEREKRWHLWADRCTRWLVQHNVCVSRSVAEFSQREARLRPERVSVIPNGVDYDRFAEATPAKLSQFGIPDGATTILAVGRLHPQKGHLHLIEAMEPILNRQPHVHLLIVGEGPLRGRLEAETGRRNLSRQVHLVGRQDDVPGLLRAATLCVLPSLWEGMPNVVLEAMAAGTPVVATAVEGVDELLSNGESGIIVNSNCINGLRTGIDRCLADPALRKRLARSSQIVTRNSFTIDKMVQEYDQLYRRLLLVPQ